MYKFHKSFLHRLGSKKIFLIVLGTNQRWEVVASFINQHTKTPEVVRNAKETLSKAKELQHSDFHASSMKDEANKRAFENLEKQKKRDVKVIRIIKVLHIQRIRQKRPSLNEAHLDLFLMPFH